ncbi:hypothetical protein ACWGLE_16345 [Streptomyces sp. NPDC055897]
MNMKRTVLSCLFLIPVVACAAKSGISEGGASPSSSLTAEQVPGSWVSSSGGRASFSQDGHFELSGIAREKIRPMEPGDDSGKVEVSGTWAYGTAENGSTPEVRLHINPSRFFRVGYNLPLSSGNFQGNVSLYFWMDGEMDPGDTLVKK